MAKKKELNEIFKKALDNFIKKYRKNELRILSEGDFRAFVSLECHELMKKRDNIEIYEEEMMGRKKKGKKRKKIDLTLGRDQEVCVEFKFEPNPENKPSRKKECRSNFILKKSGQGNSVEDDIEKIKKYSKQEKYAHFVMLDETPKNDKKAPGGWLIYHIAGEKSKKEFAGIPRKEKEKLAKKWLISKGLKEKEINLEKIDNRGYYLHIELKPNKNKKKKNV